jgi:YD repeat-containing protein
MAIGSNPVGAPELSRTTMFDRNGSSWVEGAIISPLGGSFGDLEGTRVLVASPYDFGVYKWTGVVRIFDWIAGSWVETAMIQPDVPNFWGLLFGLRVALTGDRFIISSKLDGGTLYQYERDGHGNWTEIGRVNGPPGYLAFDELALDGERLLVSTAWDGPGRVTEYLTGPTEEVYCEAVPNSTGAAALISASTCNSVAENQFSLRAEPVPNQPGLFFYGSAPTQVPFGPGFLCLGGAIIRLPVQMAQGGSLTLDVDLSMPPNAAGQITAGSTWYFQAWFRDPSDPAAFNLSDAIAIRFL